MFGTNKVKWSGSSWVVRRRDPLTGRGDIFKGYGEASLKKFVGRDQLKPKPWSHGVLDRKNQAVYGRNRFGTTTIPGTGVKVPTTGGVLKWQKPKR